MTTPELDHIANLVLLHQRGEIDTVTLARECYQYGALVGELNGTTAAREMLNDEREAA